MRDAVPPIVARDVKDEDDVEDGPAVEPREDTAGAGIAAIPVIAVTFRNAADVTRCLAALGRMGADPDFGVFICENGGPAAFDTMLAALTGPDGPCSPDLLPPLVASPRFARMVRLRLATGDAAQHIAVHVGESCENGGYAGGVNAYIEALLPHPGWPGVWVLNPDTEPAPGALRELVDHAARRGCGMVGSRLVSPESPDLVQNRGLAWRKWRAATIAVDRLAPGALRPAAEAVEQRIDAPSGASIYVTRDCMLRIGLMDERYFLYFEDLDWGLRAKRVGPVGYAHDSIVLHEGGTTIGSGATRRQHSPLAIYLEFRNRLLFVRRHHMAWLAWAVVMEILELLEYARTRAFATMFAGARGLWAGVLGRTGRPDALIRAHVERAERARTGSP